MERRRWLITVILLSLFVLSAARELKVHSKYHLPIYNHTLAKILAEYSSAGFEMIELIVDPEASVLALPLMDMLSSRALCHHVESHVRRLVLFAASCILVALHPSYVASALVEGNSDVSKGLEWIRTWALHVGVFTLGSIPDNPSGSGGYLQTSVMAADFKGFVEIVFENSEDNVQSWHVDGHHFFVVGMNGGEWSPASRDTYNLKDTVARCTVQVHPSSWTAIYMPLDNVGMWSIRSENWARQYLGQQFYLRV